MGSLEQDDSLLFSAYSLDLCSAYSAHHCDYDCSHGTGEVDLEDSDDESVYIPDNEDDVSVCEEWCPSDVDLPSCHRQRTGQIGNGR